MFVVWQKGLVGRPTMDADMEFRGEVTPEGLKRVFAEIMSLTNCSLPESPEFPLLRFDLDYIGLVRRGRQMKCAAGGGGDGGRIGGGL